MLCFLVLVAGITAAPPAALADDSDLPLRFAGLVQSAALIVTGEVTAQQEDRVTVEVSQVLKGETADKQLKLAVFAGVLDDWYPGDEPQQPQVPGGQRLFVQSSSGFLSYAAGSPEGRYAEAVIALLDSAGAPPRPEDKADLVWWYREVFASPHTRREDRLAFLEALLRRADPGWEGVVFPLPDGFYLADTTEILLQWLDRYSLDSFFSDGHFRAFVDLADPKATPYLVRAISDMRISSRVVGSSRQLSTALDALGASDSHVYRCMLEGLQDGELWLDDDGSEGLRTQLQLESRLRAIPAHEARRTCSFDWLDYVSVDPSFPDLRSPRFENATLDHKIRAILTVALYIDYQPELVDRLVQIGTDEARLETRSLALTTAARLTARAPKPDQERATRLFGILRAQTRGDSPQARLAWEGAAAMVPELASVRAEVARLYRSGGEADREWAFQIWGRTNFARMPPDARLELAQMLIASNPRAEDHPLEGEVLARLDRAGDEPYGLVLPMLRSADFTEAKRGLRWAVWLAEHEVVLVATVQSLYATGSKPLRARALQALTAVWFGAGQYPRLLPYLDEMIADVAAAEPDLRDQSRAVLEELIRKECLEPGRYEGLDAVLPTLFTRLGGAEGVLRIELRVFLTATIRELDAECVSMGQREALER